MKKLKLLAIAALFAGLCSCGNGQKADTLGDVVSAEKLDSVQQAAKAEAINNPTEVTQGAPQNADVEGLLAKYKTLVDQYDKFSKKSSCSNVNELALKSSELAKQINETQQEIIKYQGQMSDTELTRLSRLSRKFTDASKAIEQVLAN
jgi:hypothetical protein